jgi:hypothetical protein
LLEIIVSVILIEKHVKEHALKKMTISLKKIKNIMVYGKYIPILLLLLTLGNCNFGTPDYRLDVILEEGVTGTPQEGEHTYKDLSQVEYEYTAIDPIHTVEVFLNEYRQTYSGTFTMYTDVTLVARLVDIRGRWSVTIQQTDPSETISFDITLEGAGLTNGTFSNSRGKHGYWTAESGVVTITFTDWNFVVLEGGVYDMSGIYSVGEEANGAWSADRLS